jgi:hypothetical protein
MIARIDEAANTAAIGGDPIDAVAALQQEVDRRVRQPVRSIESGELMTVEPAQPVSRAKPDESPGVLHYALDKGAFEAVGRRVSGDGEAFSAGGWLSKCDESYRPDYGAGDDPFRSRSHRSPSP